MFIRKLYNILIDWLKIPSVSPEIFSGSEEMFTMVLFLLPGK